MKWNWKVELIKWKTGKQWLRMEEMKIQQKFQRKTERLGYYDIWFIWYAYDLSIKHQRTHRKGKGIWKKLENEIE